MTTRVVQLVALAAAVAVALVAGTFVREQLAAPGPVATAEAATEAYAEGDCPALRKVSQDPAAVDCQDVSAVRDAYRAEQLDPDEFSYSVVAHDDDRATVRITYDREGYVPEELVQLVRDRDDWKIETARIGPT